MVLILHEDSPLVMSTGFGASGLGFALTASAHRASDKLLLSSLDLSFLICELGMVMVLNARTVVRRNEGVEERRPGSAGPCPIAAAAAPVGALPCLSTEASLVSSHLSVENLPPSTSSTELLWDSATQLQGDTEGWTLQTGVQPALAKLKGGPVTPPCWSWVLVHLVPLRGSCDCSAWRSGAALGLPRLPPVTHAVSTCWL